MLQLSHPRTRKDLTSTPSRPRKFWRRQIPVSFKTLQTCQNSSSGRAWQCWTWTTLPARDYLILSIWKGKPSRRNKEHFTNKELSAHTAEKYPLEKGEAIFTSSHNVEDQFDMKTRISLIKTIKQISGCEYLLAFL
jgi:hypothetical protein